jgi:hypothetical protein
MGAMSQLQDIIDRHAAATPGPHYVEVIDDHGGRPDSRKWLICDLAREQYGDNAVSFGEDEKTARFVAATFTDVPVMAAALHKAETILHSMEDLLSHCAVISSDFAEVAVGLRKALELDGKQ